MRDNQIIRKIVSRNMRDNRNKNLAAIIAIALTALMFTAVFTVGTAMLASASLVGAGIDSSQGLLMVIAILVIILSSGYLIIYNIFQISVARDIQFYGRLKTLGASDWQIRKIVFSQALYLSAVGIPVGLVTGYAIGALLIPIILVSFGSNVIISASPVIFIGAALFALLTVFISAAKPAAAAGNISPVAAMVYADNETASKKRSKRKIKRSPATPRSMAHRNLKRNTKRTRRMILSIALGFALMNSFYVYHHSFDEDAYVRSFIQSDIAAAGEITPEMITEISELPGVTQSGTVWYTETEQAIKPDVLQRIIAYYDEEDSGQQWWIEDDEDAFRQYQALKQTGETTVSVYGADAYTAGMGSVYAGEYDEERFVTGNYVLSFGIADNGEGSEHYEIGEIIEIQGRQYEVMALIDPADTVKGSLHSPQNQMEIDYVIHTERFFESFSPTHSASMLIETADNDTMSSLSATLSSLYPDLSVTSRSTYAASFQSQTLAISAMGYALGFIMALIGILNFVNTILSTIIARKHEFTMLESIGMLKKQLKRMLIHESMYYVIRALILSISAAILIAATFIQEAVSSSWVANYSFSLTPFAVIVPILVLLAIVIPVSCFQGTQKQSLVERLRS